MFHGSNEIKIIGTRHGEKQHETLLTREEMVKATDLDLYFRIPADNRNLNYDKFFSEGQEKISLSQEYNSFNTQRLNVEQIKELLSNLYEIQHQSYL